MNPTMTPFLWPSFVGEYTSAMEHMGYDSSVCHIFVQESTSLTIYTEALGDILKELLTIQT